MNMKSNIIVSATIKHLINNPEPVETTGGFWEAAAANILNKLTLDLKGFNDSQIQSLKEAMSSLNLPEIINVYGGIKKVVNSVNWVNQLPDIDNLASGKAKDHLLRIIPLFTTLLPIEK
jgi:hypothetical protein